jgi:hypothetical protein
MIQRLFNCLKLTRHSVAVGLLCLVALVFSWPFPQIPRMWPDSAGYLSWSAERMPVYTILASTLNASYLLVCVHYLLSMAAWSWLGYAIGRGIGMAIGLVFAISLPVYVFHLVVLSETVSLSLLAALLASTISVCRRWSKSGFRVWCAFLFLFAMTRVINLFLLPFLVVPFVVCGRRRLLAAALALTVVTGCGVLYSATLGTPLRETSLTNVYMRRIAMDKDKSAWFMARGMPFGNDVRQFVNRTGSENKFALFEACPHFAAWLREDGDYAYLRWVIGRAGSWTAAWTEMFDHVNDTNRRFSAGTRMRSVPRHFEQIYVRLYVPYWLWLSALFLPLLSWRVYGRVNPVTLLVVAMMFATYVQAFVGYNGDATEESRHMISAFYLYKITVVLLVYEVTRAVVYIVRKSGQNGGFEAGESETTR